MIDTHAHLDAFEDAGEVLERARAAGVGRVVDVGTTIASCRAVLDLCEREAGVFAALGLHPHEAGSVGDEQLRELKDLLEHPKAVAVGETGLDYYRDLAPRDRQARRVPRAGGVGGGAGQAAGRAHAGGGRRHARGPP